ncbi:MAG: lipopolysaccharide kinase InaA family protein [Myxococcota bacterium]
MGSDGQVRVLFCDACGAPLDARAFDAFVLCRYCSSNNAIGAPSASAILDDGRPRVNVGGRTYVIEGKLARGDASDVYRARWATRLGELVVLRVNRSSRDADHVRRGVTSLEQIWRSADPRWARITARLPRPIALGPVTRDGIERQVAVVEWRSGFVHSLADVAAAWPSGIDGRIGVWILRRVFEALAVVHRAGLAHGAVLPKHVLVHPRDHGATLCGFGSTVEIGERIPGIVAPFASFYPADRRAMPKVDHAQAARTVSSLCTFAEPVASFVRRVAAGQADADGFLLTEELAVHSRAAYGPPAYNPLPMPGWR